MALRIISVALLVLAAVNANIIYVDNNSNEVDSNSTEFVEYVLLGESNPCARTCVRGATPMICRYRFVLEYYHTLSKACYDCPHNLTDCFRKDCVPGDGYKRNVATVNRTLPGPMIQVCKDDILVVDVVNDLETESTTMHWHGQHQRTTPYMDGVPYVTQCPIPPHSTFRYTFKATQAGTHFWHSHSGMQRADGAFGAFIVKLPEEEEPNSQFYDYDLPEHVMVIIDWDGKTGQDFFLSHHHNDGDNKPSSMLINGLGRFKQFDTETNQTIYTPTARFTVEQGYRYRFRIINAGYLNCPIEVSIDNHTLKVISSDGNDIAPVEAASLVTYAGERFDVIVDADQKKSLYWIRFRGLMDCDERFTKAYQTAVLEYGGLDVVLSDYPEGEQPNWDNSHRSGVQVNALNRGIESNESFISMPQVESLQKWDISMKVTPDFQYYIAYDFYKIDNNKFHRAPYYGFNNFSDPNMKLLTPQFNRISMKIPPFALLPQRDQVKADTFCNAETMKDQDCINKHCECYHGIKIPLGAVVELIFVDEGFAYDANHPIHLHGYAFRVVAMERMGANVTVEEVKERDRLGLIQRNLLDAPLKDTVTVPDGGYTIVRFEATNPGFWVLHCHLEFHAEIGMMMVLQVGESKDMRVVPANFPKCGNYMPETLLDENDNVMTPGTQGNNSGKFDVNIILLTILVFLAFFGSI